MALPLNELKIKVIVDYESGKLINVDKLVAELVLMNRKIEALEALEQIGRNA